MANQVDIIIRAIDKGVKKTFGDLTGKVQKSRTALDAFNMSMKRTNKAAGALTGRLAAAFAGIGTGLVAKSLWDTGTNMQRLNLAFEAVSGSTGGAAAEIAYVRKEAERLGIVFYESAKGYKQMFAAGIAGGMDAENTRKIFSGVAEAISAMGLNAEQSTGAIRAVGQMMGKTKVMAEELRQQLGEKMATAIQDMATAYGGDVEALEKAMAAGEVRMDTLIKWADVLHDKYGPAAEKAADQAVGTMAKFKTSWFNLKLAVSDSGFLDESVTMLKRLTETLKDPAVQESIKVMASEFFKMAGAMASFAWEWKTWIASFAGGVVAISLVTRIAGAFVALNTGFKVLTGMKVASWFKRLFTSSKSAGGGMSYFAKSMVPAVTRMGVLKGVLSKVSLLLSSFGAGWAIGTMLNKMDTVKRAGIALTAGLHKAWIRLNRGWLLPGGKEKEVQKELAAIEKSYSEMFDAVGRESIICHTKTTEALQIAAKSQKKIVYKVTDEMKKKYKKYGEEVKRILLEIGGEEQSLEEQLRSMGREGMSDLGAWKDRKKEAEEYGVAAKNVAEAAKMAMENGFEKEGKMLYAEALKYLDKAKTGAAALTGEVKDGDKVLQTSKENLKIAIADVAAYGAQKVEIMKQQAKAVEAIRGKMDDQSGQRLSGKDAIVAVSDATKKYAHMVIPSMGKAYTLVWDNAAREGQAMIGEIDLATDKMINKKRVMKIDVVTTQVKKLGGVVAATAMAAGGRVRNAAAGFHFPGYGGGDRPKNLVMAEDGEVMIRKEMVKRAGLRAALAFNSGRFDILLSELMQRFSPAGVMMKQMGGLIAPMMPQPQPLLMSGGGAVAGGGGSSSTMNVNLNLPTSGPPIQTNMNGSQAQELLRQIKNMGANAA